MNRPVGVTIFGCLFTVTGAVGILGALSNRLALKGVPVPLYWAHILLSLLFFICGILLLRMHSKSWLFALGLFLVSFVANIIALEASRRLSQNVATQFHIAVMASIGLSLAYDLYGLYYFTRASVRQKFFD